ncbi:MAG: Xaa-Pro peptidase family protein [Pseudomonadota bacterium]|nr:Xaa-Pro peptidase family protein [Pseudomonadota bacterium]
MRTRMGLNLNRRGFLGAGTAMAAMLSTGPVGAAAAQAQNSPIKLPPAITREERLARLATARSLMQRHGIGAILVEPGASLDYFTGVQWGRSERLTAAVIPAQGEPIIVTPFFEKPSVEESLGMSAEVRVWQEDEEPLKLVADFLKERGVAAQPLGFEETNRFFILDRLQQQMPGARIVSANAVVRASRMIKSTAEIALMKAATDVTIAAFRELYPQLKAGWTASQVEEEFGNAVRSLGGSNPWGLVLFGPASALPHGTGKPQTLARGDVVLLDCGCSVHGYQADVSRTFVFGAPPTAKQRKVWNQMHRGQQIAFAAARVGVPAGSVDDAVRRAYESWGYGPRYQLPGLSHRTGHGIGMEGHEPVNLVHGETTLLAPGMCFSDEPGIYIPGEFGVRLEDCLYMTEAGPRWFSTPPQSIDRPFA